MKGLIVKDFYVLNKTLKTYVGIMVFYGFLGYMSGQASFLVTMSCVMCAMLPITALAYDERSKWDHYALTMPLTRTDIVVAKYMLGFILVLIGFLIAFISTLFIKDMSLGEKLLSVGTSLGISLLYQAITMPLMFKFGAEKGRFYMFAVILLPVVIVMAVAKFNENFVRDIVDFISANETTLPIILIAVVAVAYAISVLISINIYNKKEF